MKKDVDTLNEDAGELEVAINANIKTKEELLQQMIDKDVIKNEMITVAGQRFIEYERERDDPHQKKFEDIIVDFKIKVLQIDVIHYENDDNIEHESIRRFLNFQKKVLTQLFIS